MKKIHQRLIEIQNSQKEQFNRSHRAKDLRVLKVNEQVRFFPNKQGTGQTNWLTGSVSKILDCGHSYTITGPNSRVYRRNRAHLKPICYDGLTFQACTTTKEDKQPKKHSFQDPKRVKTVSFQTDTADVMARAVIFDEPDKHSSHPPSHPSVQQQHYSPRSPSHSPPIIFSTQEKLSGTQCRGIHTQRQGEMQVQASLHLTQRR